MWADKTVAAFSFPSESIIDKIHNQLGEEKAKNFDVNNVSYLKLPEKEQNQLLWTLYSNFQSYISFGRKLKKNLSSSTTSKYDTEYRAEGVLWGERNDPNYFSSTCIIDEVKYVYYVLF